MLLTAFLLLPALLRAADRSPPVIHLDLDERVLNKYSTANAGLPCNGFHSNALADHVLCRPRQGAAYGDQSNRRSEDYAKECIAKKATVGTCPGPTARAYDHHDGNIKVVSTLYLVNNDGNLRSEWLLTFDATDASGNKAQQLVFAMILNDPIAPVITPRLLFPIRLESCDPAQLSAKNPRYWRIPLRKASALDNYDGVLSSAIELTVQSPAKWAAPRKYSYGETIASAEPLLDSRVLGQWTLTYAVHDHAGLFGKHGVDNIGSVKGVINVVDSKPPKVSCKRRSCRLDEGGYRQGGTALSTSSATSVEDCCDKCDQYAWLQPSLPDSSSCSYFHYTASTSACVLFAGVASDVLTPAGSTGIVGGRPIGCASPNTIECGTAAYKDPGAVCVDLRDSLQDDGQLSATALTPTTTLSPGASAAVAGSFDVTYTCSDAHSNAAVPKTRRVNVVDTQPPLLTLFGDYQVQVFCGTPASLQQLKLHWTAYGKGFSCSDTCSSGTNSVISHMAIYNGNCEGTWTAASGTAVDGPRSDPVPLMLMHFTPGTYGLKMTCSDAAGNQRSRCRTIINVDTEVCTTPAPTLVPTQEPTTTSPTAVPTVQTPAPTPAPTPATCVDGLRNGDETDIDCGGSCPMCGPGKVCAVHTDCSYLECTNGLCSSPAPTSAPTAMPTYVPCAEVTVHSCDSSTSYCGIKDDGSGATFCPCLHGYMADPTSDTRCIVITQAPTSAPTFRILKPTFPEETVGFRLVLQPNTIAYLNKVYELMQAFIVFWSGEHLEHVQRTIDHYEFGVHYRYAYKEQGRRLESGDDDAFGAGERELQVVELDEAIVNSFIGLPGAGARAAQMKARRLAADPDWQVPVQLTGRAHKRMYEHALSLRAACPPTAEAVSKSPLGCLPRSSPYQWAIDVRVVVKKGFTLGVFCLRDTITHIIDSNDDSKAPDFCGDKGAALHGQCTKKTVHDYFNDLKHLMLSSFQAKLKCTAAPTAAPTPAPSSTPTAAASRPVLNVFGGDVVTHEASRTGYYKDEGATCVDILADMNVRDISLNVVVSGQSWPSFDSPGTYTVKYSCKGEQHAEGTQALEAVPTRRTVVIADTVCPVCTLRNGATRVEASFPFVDPGAECVDNLDGLLTGVVTTSGAVDAEKVGIYRLTYRARDSSGNWNDGAGGGCTNASSSVRTVTVVDTLKPVLTLAYEGKSIQAGHGGSAGAGGQENPAANEGGYLDMQPVRRRLAVVVGRAAGAARALSWSPVPAALAPAALLAGCVLLVLHRRRAE